MSRADLTEEAMQREKEQVQRGCVTASYGVGEKPIFIRDNSRCAFCRHLSEQKRASLRFDLMSSPHAQSFGGIRNSRPFLR
jgi:hypothetical protein